MAGTLSISGQSTSDPAGSRTFGPFTLTGTNPSGETLEVIPGSGDNTIAIPAGMSVALILTPVGTQTLKLRSNLNNSDTGLTLVNGQPTVYPLPSGSTSLIVNSSGALTTALTVAFV